MKEQAAASVRPFCAAESSLLDLVRVSAAVLVVVGHLTQPYFSTGLPNLTFLANKAVVVFFLLSGFVIRYATCRRRTDLRGYLVDRASRIYSVAIPALVFTIVADTVAGRANPGFYAFWVGETTHPVLRMFANTAFFAQWWTLAISPFSNSPFWSLIYEVAYYVLYGLWFYLTGFTRWICIAVFSLLIGPKILLLLPVWILGSYAHDLYQRWNHSDRGRSRLNAMCLACLGLVTTAFVAVSSSNALRTLVQNGRGWLLVESRIWRLEMSSDFVGAYLWGTVGIIALLRFLLLARDHNARLDVRALSVLHLIAEGTFPIYLLHFPLLVLVAACVPYNHGSAPQKLLILLSVIALGVAAGAPANVLKVQIRRVFHG